MKSYLPRLLGVALLGVLASCASEEPAAATAVDQSEVGGFVPPLSSPGEDLTPPAPRLASTPDDGALRGEAELDALIGEADVIATGVVVSAAGHRRPDGAIMTTVVLRIDRGLRGAAPGHAITYQVHGGVVGEDGQYVTGAVVPRVDESLLVFLRSDDEHRPVGRSHATLRADSDGKFTILNHRFDAAGLEARLAER